MLDISKWIVMAALIAAGLTTNATFMKEIATLRMIARVVDMFVGQKTASIWESLIGLEVNGMQMMIVVKGGAHLNTRVLRAMEIVMPMQIALGPLGNLALQKVA